MPPSPESEITCRSGKAALAPNACGIALAIVPWVSETIVRLRPVEATWRRDQTIGDPPSAV